MTAEIFYSGCLISAAVVLGILILAAILRSVLGPRITDRIIAVNMIGTLTMAIIAILTILLGEDYLGDVCIVYAMVSFLAVVVLCKVYTGIYLEKKQIHGDLAAIENNLEHQEKHAGASEKKEEEK